MTATILSSLATPDLTLIGKPELPSVYAARLATDYAALVSEGLKRSLGNSSPRLT
jgi:hypothetical protein